MSHSATARLFVALELPRTLTDELSAWARAAVGQAGAGGQPVAKLSRSGYRRSHSMRMVHPESMHLTLSFLGSRPVHEIEPLAAIVESLGAPQQIAQAQLGAPLWLPPRRPRALAVEVHDRAGTIAEIHESLIGELRAAGLWPQRSMDGASRRRALRPHVTVARVRGGAVPRERSLSATPQRSFAARKIVLYRSWLSQEGASYEPLAARELSGQAVERP